MYKWSPADSQTALWAPEVQLLPAVPVGPEDRETLERQQYQEHP